MSKRTYRDTYAGVNPGPIVPPQPAGTKPADPTPGPYMWKHNEDVTKSIMIYTADGKAAIAKLVTHIHEYGVEYIKEAEANATLLTSAPEMLAALKQMQRSLNGSPGNFGAMLAAHRAVDAAIAKAEGR